jgi:hypothetical protein
LLGLDLGANREASLTLGCLQPQIEHYYVQKHNKRKAAAERPILEKTSNNLCIFADISSNTASMIISTARRLSSFVLPMVSMILSLVGDGLMAYLSLGGLGYIAAFYFTIYEPSLFPTIIYLNFNFCITLIL